MWPEKWNKNENKNVRIIQDSKDDIQIIAKKSKKQAITGNW